MLGSETILGGGGRPPFGGPVLGQLQKRSGIVCYGWASRGRSSRAAYREYRSTTVSWLWMGRSKEMCAVVPARKLRKIVVEKIYWVRKGERWA